MARAALSPPAWAATGTPLGRATATRAASAIRNFLMGSPLDGPAVQRAGPDSLLALGRTALRAVLEAGEVEGDPLLDPVGPQPLLFDSIAAVAELHPNAALVTRAWLELA